MLLPRGTRLSQYEIRALLGVGGMGEVYRAADTKLRRDVAIKLLPAELSEDQDRLARFQREAQILASLNHPNIAAIYDLQVDGDRQFLVLELVEGETLADRLRRGALPLIETLEVGKQIAAALETAHEKGILHRDLKPSNVQISTEGIAKVLDFGLAKVLPVEATGASALATILSPAQTRIGVIMGTAAYMSPEQARGHDLDERTDLWSFGCVLYECLTGKQPFEGDDVTETLAGILKSEPDWTLLPPNTPALIRSLLRQCLGKRRDQRLGDARAARLLIEDSLATPADAPALVSAAVSPRWPRLAAVGVVLAVAGVVGGRLWSPPASSFEPSVVTRTSIGTRPAEQLVGGGGIGRPSLPAFALSPDGQTLVFTAVYQDGAGQLSRLYRRSLDALDAVPMNGTTGAIWPFFSPDGKWVAFYSVPEGKLRKIPVDGGAPIDVVNVGRGGDANIALSGAVWEADTIYYAVGGRGVLAVPSRGGTPTTVVAPAPTNESLLLPYALPGGKSILYTKLENVSEKLEVMAQPLSGGTPKALVQGADSRYIEIDGQGYLLYMNAGALLGVRFDAATLELMGSPVTLIDDVMQAVAMPNSNSEVKAGYFSAAANGTLAYLPGGIYRGRKNMIAWVGRDGATNTVDIPPGQYIAPRISPDGRRVVMMSVRPGSRYTDIQLFDIDRPLLRRLTLDGINRWAEWLENDSIVFQRTTVAGTNLVTLNVDGNDPPIAFTAGDYGRGALAVSVAAGAGALWAPDYVSSVRLDDREAEPTPVVRSATSHVALSPDGRRLAFVSFETGLPEVYDVAFPSGAGKMRVSPVGGLQPAWSNDGRELYYTRPAGRPFEWQVVVVPMQPSVGSPKVLFTATFEMASPMRDYDVEPMPEGRFLVVLPPEKEEPPVRQIELVLNWTTEVKRRIEALGR
jgi:serine/threonine protein kinase/Tol biopolymer transport system component